MKKKKKRKKEEESEETSTLHHEWSGVECVRSVFACGLRLLVDDSPLQEMWLGSRHPVPRWCHFQKNMQESDRYTFFSFSFSFYTFPFHHIRWQVIKSLPSPRLSLSLSLCFCLFSSLHSATVTVTVQLWPL